MKLEGKYFHCNKVFGINPNGQILGQVGRYYLVEVYDDEGHFEKQALKSLEDMKDWSFFDSAALMHLSLKTAEETSPF